MRLIQKFLIVPISLIFISVILNNLFGNNWQYWCNCKIKKRINKNFSFVINPQVKTKQNDEISLYWFQAVPCIQWNIKKYLISSFCYQHIRYKKKEDWKTEYRPNVSITLKFKLNQINLSDRNRMEYRIKDDKKIPRYRNKLTIKLPIKKIKLTPNLAGEIFYDFNAKEINKYRIYSGATYKIYRSLKISLTYFSDNNYKKKSWQQTNVLKTGIEYEF